MSRFFGDSYFGEIAKPIAALLVVFVILSLLVKITNVVIDRMSEREVVENERSYIIESEYEEGT